jgi:CHAT domain-containing protein
MNRFFHITILIIIISSCVLKANNQDFTKDSILMENYYNAAMERYASGFYPEALDSFRYSYEIAKQILDNNHPNLRKINNALGITYRTIGQFDNAIKHFLLVEHSYLAAPEGYELAIARLYNNIGNVYYNKFSYVVALEYYQRAADIMRQEEMNYEWIADIYYSIANIHYELHNNKKALEIINNYYSHAGMETKLYFFNLKSAVLQELNDIDGAYKSYNSAIEFAKKLYSKSDINVAFQYLNFAKFLISDSRFREAEEVMEKAYDIFIEKNIKEGLNLALYYKTMGIYYENINVETKNIDAFREQKSENLSNAIEYYKKGLEALNFNLTNLSEGKAGTYNCISQTQSLDFFKLIADTYVIMSELYKEDMKERYSESIYKALDYYKITSNLIQKARKDIYSEDSKIQLSELEETTFSKIIQTAYKAYMIKREHHIIEFAFQNAERQKASSIFDKLTDQLAKESSLIPDSLMNLGKTLNYSITSNSEKLYNLHKSNNADPAEINRIDSIIFRLKKQRDELNYYMENNYTGYYSLKYSNTAVHIVNIQNSLRNNEVIIEYVLNENDSVPELYSFCICKGCVEFKKLDISPTFLKSLEKTFRFLSNTEFMFTKNKQSKDFCIAAHNLYKDLIKPFENGIINKKLTIIPDGKLSYIPFDVLLTEIPDTSGFIQFQRLPYLIRKNTINYAYSANLLINYNRLTRNSKNRLLAFAPDYKSDTVTFEQGKLMLKPLPGIQDEVDLISQEIKTDVFKGKEATEMNFRNNYEDYDILHLAMHAFINDSLPAFSRFAFSQNIGVSRENDGWLNTADIYNLDLNSRLAVLSACNTGSGILRKGEGVMSLARGFIYAGCPSIIMTLWEVEDNAGTQIMTSFYRNLKKGKHTDVALRLAKIEYLENANSRMAHPHYWLSYVSIGNSSPLFISYDFYFFILLVIVIMAIITDQLIRLKKSSKDNLAKEERYFSP